MRMRDGKKTRVVYPLLLLALASCAPVQKDTPGNAVEHLFAQPPQRAGACFARNAEEHSSALVAEVRPPDARGRVEVIVRVKNGVTYATADIRPVRDAAEGTLTLMAISSRGSRELLRTLIEGC